MNELITNKEVTCLLLHDKYWKYYALCNIPYKALKVHKLGRYKWESVKPANFENKVVRLKEDWREILGND